MKLSIEDRELKRAYSRGYNAGRAGYWPCHRPPLPPEPHVQALMEALSELRDVADTITAVLEPNDEFSIILGPRIDQANNALMQVSNWLEKQP